MSILSAVYGRAARFRRAWYGRHPARVRRLGRPVVSVGNLVVGGSGKTPVVAAIARCLAAAGERPAILSRGYGGTPTTRGVLVVSDGMQVLAPARESGDEPQMLARSLANVPVLVSPDRYAAGRLGEQRFDCTVYLLDDGFQHLQLWRDVNLLVMARADLDERLLPSGRLREPLAAASAADALLVAGTAADAEAVAHRVGIRPVFRVVPRYARPRLATGGAPIPDGHARVVAVAGIARPERFFTAVRAEGFDVAREIVFRDHHWFSARDLDRVQSAAAAAAAACILTTEKDAVRLDARALGAARVPWAYLPMEVAIEPPAIDTWLVERLAEARRRGAAA